MQRTRGRVGREGDTKKEERGKLTHTKDVWETIGKYKIL